MKWSLINRLLIKYKWAITLLSINKQSFRLTIHCFYVKIKEKIKGAGKMFYSNDSIEKILRKIVFAIGNGLEDAGCSCNDYRSAKKIENSTHFFYSDAINSKILDLCVDGLSAVRFKRISWNLLVVVDEINKRTYNVMTKETFENAKKKLASRNTPYYLQSICHVENGNFNPCFEQLTLDGLDNGEKFFTNDELANDYYKIFGNKIDSSEYSHYTIVYSHERESITELELLKLDENLETIEHQDISEYITPQLPLYETPYSENQNKAETKNNLRLKPGVKPQLKNDDNENNNEKRQS